MKNLKFWGRFWLEGMGIMVGVSLLIIFFVGVQYGDSTVSGGAEWLLAMYPWYLMFAVFFVLFILSSSAYQVYLSVLVSMNATRRGAVGGMLICMAGLIAGPLALSGGIWTVIENDVAVSGRSLFMSASGCLFAVGGIALFVSGVALRWKRWGKIILSIVMMIVGGAAGAAAALSGSITKKVIDISQIGVSLSGRTVSMVILAVGVGLYLLASAFTVLITRRMEVRV